MTNDDVSPASVAAEGPAYPTHWEADVVLRDGATARVRPIQPFDADALQTFHIGQSERSRYFRFFAPMERLSEKDVERFTHVDNRDRVALVAVIADAIIGVGRYDRVNATSAEVAFNIADAHQGRGLGSVLLEHLVAAAREHGIKEFVAEVLPTNTQMLTVFTEAGFEVHEEYEDGVVYVSFAIEPTTRSMQVQASREQRAESRSVRRILRPESVAVLGAGREPESVGYRILANLVDAGFTGRLYAVNREYADTVSAEHDPVVYVRHVGELPEAVDLAVVAVPAAATREMLEECVAKGIRAVVLVSTGFGESGEAGEGLQRDILEIVRANGIRMVGPASYGVFNTDPEVQLNASLTPRLPRAGGVGLFSQSAAMGMTVLDSAVRRDLGLSTFVSAGNRADLSGNDMMQYWIDDPNTQVGALYLESVGNPRKFYRIARRLSAVKPLIVVKTGMSGGRAGEVGRPGQSSIRELFDEMFRQAGVIKAENTHQLLDIAQLLAHQPMPAGPRVGIVANSASLAAVMAGAAEGWGLAVVRPASSLPTNIDRDTFAATLAETLADPLVDVVALSYVTADPMLDPEIAEMIAQMTAASGKTAVLAAFGLRGIHPNLTAQDPDGVPRTVPAYASPEDAVLALAAAVQYAQWRAIDHGQIVDPDALEVEQARLVVESLLAESSAEAVELERSQAAELLRLYGIALAESDVVHDADEAVAAASRIGWPVVLKTMDEHLRHRSDLGGVRLDIGSEDELRDDVAQMMARYPTGRAAAMEVQAMVPDGVSCVLRSAEDPDFGPILSFGLAGDAIELLGDVAHRVPPLTETDVSSLIRSIRAAPRLFGYRGLPPADVDSLEDIIGRLAALADDVPELRLAELNPIVVSPDGATALGARLVLARASRPDAVRRVLPD